MNVKIFVLVFAMGIAAVGIVGCETQNPICTENFCVTGEVFPRSALGDREFSEVDVDDSRLLAALAGIPEPTTPVDETVDNTLVELENNSNFVPISLLLSKPADYNKQIIVTRAYVNEIFIYDDGSKSAVLGELGEMPRVEQNKLVNVVVATGIDLDDVHALEKFWNITTKTNTYHIGLVEGQEYEFKLFILATDSGTVGFIIDKPRLLI